MPSHSKFREQVAGLDVTEVHYDPSGVEITFGTEWTLIIWCRVVLRLGGHEAALARLHALTGLTLLRFEQRTYGERLTFSGDAELLLHPTVRDAGQTEGMVLRGPDSVIEVWND
jgi:hypothetical protein